MQTVDTIIAFHSLQRTTLQTFLQCVIDVGKRRNYTVCASLIRLLLYGNFTKCITFNTTRAPLSPALAPTASNLWLSLSVSKNLVGISAAMLFVFYHRLARPIYMWKHDIISKTEMHNVSKCIVRASYEHRQHAQTFGVFAKCFASYASGQTDRRTYRSIS